MLISNNLLVRKYDFNLTLYGNENVGLLRRFSKRIILKRASTEARVYARRYQGAKCKHFDISGVIFCMDQT